MIKTYTDRGRAWETVNSWWVLLTFAPFGLGSFLSFLYIGFRVKHWPWLIYGLIYLGATIAAFSLSGGISTAIAVSSWIISIIHAFKTRSSFLIQLDVYKANEKVREQHKMDRLRQEAQAKFQIPDSTTQFKPPVPKVKSESDVRNFAVDDTQKENRQAESATSDASDAPPTNTTQTGNGRRVDF
ncbi:hypothetical protein [Paenibacillus motobuensis]|uniref:Uncharacterized protein n=1 Tax=Paenibacillus motobuensis TaxID=295324 RepID=A0ABP3HRY8_9BACL